MTMPGFFLFCFFTSVCSKRQRAWLHAPLPLLLLCSYLSAISSCWHFPSRALPRAAPLPSCVLGSALQGNPGTIRGQSLIWELQPPREGIVPPGWRVIPRWGRALPAQQGLKLPASLPLHSAWKCWGRQGPVPFQLTQLLGTMFFLQPSKQKLAITSLNCIFHRHPHGSCSFVSQEPPMLLEIGLCVSSPVQRGCREHLMIVTASPAERVSPSPLPFFFLSALG